MSCDILNTVKLKYFLIGPLLSLLVACSDGSGNPVFLIPETDDLLTANSSLNNFVDTTPEFSGASLIVVDKRAGVIHRHYAGDHDEDTVQLLASTSKMPAVSLLMALAEDDQNVDFEIDRVIEDYLPYTGVWPGRTVEQLVSNTSGIPGLQYASQYGPHLCQYLPVGQLQTCAQTIYQTPLDSLPSYPPGTNFDYGGSPWQLAGAVAEIVGGATWNQLFDQYIREPCGLDVFEFGNMLLSPGDWSGHPDGLVGRDNPSIEGGAISNIEDYAKLLSMHLNAGRCGDQQVLSAEAVTFMLEDRATPTGAITPGGWGYGMGWWVVQPEDIAEAPSLFLDPGAFGAVAWIDTEREYAALFLAQSSNLEDGSLASGYAIGQLITLIESAYDNSRP